MWNDPIVAEVRAIREKIAAECGYDLGRMLARERRILRRWKGKVVTKADILRQRPSTRSALRPEKG